MEEKRFETIEKIPTWALCYIINGDPTGLSDEDIKMVDRKSVGRERVC